MGLLWQITMAIITMPSDFLLRDIFLWLSECRKFSAIFPCTNGFVVLVVVVVPPPSPHSHFCFNGPSLMIICFSESKLSSIFRRKRNGSNVNEVSATSFYPTPNLDKESMLLWNTVMGNCSSFVESIASYFELMIQDVFRTAERRPTRSIHGNWSLIYMYYL